MKRSLPRSWTGEAACARCSQLATSQHRRRKACRWAALLSMLSLACLACPELQVECSQL